MRMYMPVRLLALRASGCFGPCPSRRVFALEMTHLEISQRLQVREQLLMVTLFGCFLLSINSFLHKTSSYYSMFSKGGTAGTAKIPPRRPLLLQPPRGDVSGRIWCWGGVGSVTG